MGPKRYIAPSATEALKLVRSELGAEAMVLSNKETPEGVEIIAIAPDELSTLSTEARQAAVRAKELAQAVPASQPIGTMRQNRIGPHELYIADVAKAPLRNPDGKTVYHPDQAREKFHRPPPPRAQGRGNLGGLGGAGAPPQPEPLGADSFAPAAAAPADGRVDKLMAEVAEVKNLLQSHLAGNFWSNLQQHVPAQAELAKLLINAGFSPKLCAQLLQDLPETLELPALIETTQARLEGLLETIDAVPMFDRGGIFTFIGPTGVGKTTTVAKVAARCVLRYGRNQVALLTTDTYRIGAQEQLKVFAKILGLPVVSVRDSDDLGAKLKELAQRRIILLDTAGVSQRDTLMIEQSQVLREGSKGAHRILVMSATTDLRTQEDVILAHNQAHPGAGGASGIFATIITKTDEAAHLAASVDCLVRYGLPLLFLSNGQRVPEDLNAPNASYLAYRALRPRHMGDDATLSDAQMPAIIADNLADWTRKT